MNKITCPACGSDDIVEQDSFRSITEPYGITVPVSVKNYICNVCDMEGDFSHENEKAIVDGLGKAKESALNNILDYFARTGTSMSAIERCLELPQRTLTKWKSGATKPSAAGFALMSIIRTYPWTLEVAEKNYEQTFAMQAVIQAGISELMKITELHPAKTLKSAGVIETDTSLLKFAFYSSTPTPSSRGSIIDYVNNAREVSHEIN